ncbi:unnamed protein product [Brachionus calyciflorus]|uniref:DDE-1 domain-containing protein n=1 Tax=Brachionus calyciflorus TaxID=104777 RepID=A0A814F1Q6_9BILA|nr:unnamed protein product [Brachionus calyciflorus]
MTGDLFVLVFSIDDIDSYLQVKQLTELIVELKKSKQDQRNSTVPILILANKLDYLLESRITQRCVDSSDTQQFVSSFKSCLYSEISCKTSFGLDNGFEKLFNLANLPIEMIPSKHRRVSLNLDLTKPQFSRQLCTQQSSDPFVINNQTHDIKKNHKITNDSNSFVTGNGNSSSNSIQVDREGSFKSTAKKSFRKMTFRKHLTEACGTVWLNARRPSIRAELKLLQVKSNGKFTFNQSGLARNNVKKQLIRKYKQPRCFKNIRLTNLPVKYRFNTIAWMNSSVWFEWLKWLDLQFKHKIFLLVDNFPAHLPPNTTSFLHQLDSGIINSFKYKAIQFIDEAWDEVSSNTIYNCFQKTGMLPDSIPNDNHQVDHDSVILGNLLAKFKDEYIEKNFACLIDDPCEYINIDAELPPFEFVTNEDMGF